MCLTRCSAQFMCCCAHVQDWIDQVAKEPANQGLLRTFCIRDFDLVKRMSGLMERCGGASGHIVVVHPKRFLPEDLKALDDKEVSGLDIPASYHDEQRPALVELVARTEMLAKGQLKPNRVQVVGGLEDAHKGVPNDHGRQGVWREARRACARVTSLCTCRAV
jgi:hypothetical protein